MEELFWNEETSCLAGAPSVPVHIRVTLATGDNDVPLATMQTGASVQAMVVP